ncbi:hypothetical protein MHYP_G00267450 [Metynnis hypsauchen]
MVDTTNASILFEPALSAQREVSHGWEVTPDWAEPVVSGELGKPDMNAADNEELGVKKRAEARKSEFDFKLAVRKMELEWREKKGHQVARAGTEGKGARL